MEKTYNSNLGCGIGLRSPHYSEIISDWPKMDWFEAISENYMDTGGRPLHILEEVRRHYPVALHGTALSVGSVDPLRENYLRRLKRLVERIDPFIVSDHLCWTSIQGNEVHDLMPLPFTEEALQHIVARVEAVQAFLGRPILLENVSSYVTYRYSVIPEWEFLSEISKRSGCGILLDLNNIFVNATNHGFDPYEYLQHIPPGGVGQIHLAGHTDKGTYLFDTHSSPVIDPVWDLYRQALRFLGPISTLIEWDEEIPPYERLAEEAEKARAIYKNYKDLTETDLSLRARRAKQSRGQEIMEPVPRPEIASAASRPRNDGIVITRRHPIAPKQSSDLEGVQKKMLKKILPHDISQASKDSNAEFLHSQGGTPGEERMKVYSDGYLARYRESLLEVYEAIFHVLGESDFQALCLQYGAHAPSRDYNLNFAGREMPSFLLGSEWALKYPFLPDLARLEWQIARAFHAYHHEAFDPKQMATLPLEEWERMRLIFQPSVSLVSSPWPILDIWKNRGQNNGTYRMPSRKSQHVLVGRRDYQVRCELLEERQYRLLESLLTGRTLGEACEELSHEFSEEPLAMTHWFSRWVQDGMIFRCEIASLRSSS